MTSRKESRKSIVGDDFLQSGLNLRAIMKGNLIFHDTKTEKCFKEFLKPLHNIYLRMILVGETLVSAIFLLYFLTREHIYFKFVTVLTLNSLIGLTSLIALFRIKKFAYGQSAILLLQCYLTLLFIELLKDDSEKLTTLKTTCLAIFLEFLLLLPSLSFCRWLYISIEVPLISIYFFLRLNKFEMILEDFLIPLIVIITNTILVIITSYLNEKSYRELFHYRKRDEASLSQYQHLIKRVIPSSILIVRKGKVVFYNQESCRLLNMRSGSKLEERLSEIKIVERPKETENATSCNTYNVNILERLIPLETCNASSLNLKDLIMDEKIHSRFICGFESFSGVLKFSNNNTKESLNETNNSSHHDRYFDIKICNLAWEGSEALILILSENFLTHHMNYLREQARYKDKLLATVSHDLRTPLNGVIGILELAMEGLLDPQLKKRLIIFTTLFFYLFNPFFSPIKKKANEKDFIRNQRLEEELKFFAKIAMACYGDLMNYVYSGKDLSYIVGIEDYDKEFMKFSGYNEESILHSNWSSKPYHPSYCVVLDREEKILILTFRGSFNWADVITDLDYNYLNFSIILDEDTNEKFLKINYLMIDAGEDEKDPSTIKVRLGFNN